MSHETTEQLVERMLRPLEEALRNPGEAERGLDGLLAQIQAQEGLPAAARREAGAALEGQRRCIRDARKAAVMAAVKPRLKQLFGIAIEFRVLKRRPKKGTKPAGPQPAEQASAPAPPPEPDGQPQARNTGHSARWGTS